jgi:hypothetical protein
MTLIFQITKFFWVEDLFHYLVFLHNDHIFIQKLSYVNTKISLPCSLLFFIFLLLVKSMITAIINITQGGRVGGEGVGGRRIL